jgi:predicted NodU family carbamoyl transferase
MIVLGLSGGYLNGDADFTADITEVCGHDAAACLIRDGELLAAVEEERFTRIKKATSFPAGAIRACLDTAGVTPAEIDAVGYYSMELANDVLMKHLSVKNPEQPIRTSREVITRGLQDVLGIDFSGDRLHYVPHHVSHGLSSFLRSGMREALVVVMDGFGEGHSISVFRGLNGPLQGDSKHLEVLHTYHMDKSLGLFYLSKIELLGYGLGDEYKVMGLAPYGNPDTYRDIFGAMYDLKDDGDYELHPENWALLINGFMPRRKGEAFTQQHIDLAAALQQALERIALHVLGYWADRTGLANLCFTGGVAHNSSLNGLIVRSGKFREVFVHPASHDAGAAEGAGLAAGLLLGGPRREQPRMRHASVGPGPGPAAEIESELAAWGDLIEYEQPGDIVETSAKLLADDAVLGWVHGPSEFGPRALGNRSILADARPAANKERINAMVKKREAYRPFAPVVTADAAETYFEIPRTRANYDFMSFVVNVRDEHRELLGAVTHVDGTARLQIVSPSSNERFCALVAKFGELTGVPVLLNTSFNNNAEPIVQSVHDAVTCFLTTGLDFLVVEDFLIRRRPAALLAIDGLVVRLRPLTQVAKRIGVTPDGRHETRYEVSMRYAHGPRTEVSATAFALLEAADGQRTVGSLAGLAGGLGPDLRRELHSLWQGRYFVLRPAVGGLHDPLN